MSQTPSSTAASSADTGDAARELERILAAAGLNSAERHRAASTLDETANTPGQPDLAAQVAAVAALAARGCPSHLLYGLSIDGEIPQVLTLIERDMDLEHIWTLGENEWLKNVHRAIDSGAAPDIVHLTDGNAVSALDLANLYERGLDDTLARRLLTIAGIRSADINDILDAGCTWDDIEWATTTRLPLRAIASHLNELADSRHAGALEQAPTRIPILAAVLSVGLQAGSALDALPAAAAAHDQTWLDTATTMIADSYESENWLQAHTAIAAARQLERTPRQLADAEPPARVHPWTPPPALTAVHASAAQAPAQPGDPRQALAAELEDGGIGADDAGRIAEALTDPIYGVHPNQLVGPATVNAPLGIPAVRLIAHIITEGASTHTLTALAALNDRNGPIGIGHAAILTACGVSILTARQWAAGGADVTCTALLIAYGMNAGTAVKAARADNAWNAVTLLAGGASVNQATGAAKAFAGRSPGETFGRNIPAEDGMPITISILTALADAGGHIDEIDETTLSHAIAERLLPETDAILAVQLAGRLTHEQEHPAMALMLAYGHAVAGQSWAVTLDLPALGRDGVDVRVGLAKRILDSRQQGAPARNVTVTAGAAAAAPKAARSTRSVNR